MRAFAEAWPDEALVQQAVAQIPWGHVVGIPDKADTPSQRRCHVEKGIEAGCSRDILLAQIDSKLFERQGKAVTNWGPRA